MLDKSFKNNINHSKLKTELFIVAIYKGLNEMKFLRRVQLCQGNLDWRQGNVREFVLSSLYEPCCHYIANCVT